MYLQKLSLANKVLSEVRHMKLRSSTRAAVLASCINKTDTRLENLKKIQKNIENIGIKRNRPDIVNIKTKFGASFKDFYTNFKAHFKANPYGNCEVHADLAYLELLNQGERPYLLGIHGLDKKTGGYFEHAFVIFNTGSPITDNTACAIKPEKIPKQSIIVDPWGRYFGFCTKKGWSKFVKKLNICNNFSLQRIPDIKPDLENWVGNKLSFGITKNKKPSVNSSK